MKQAFILCVNHMNFVSNHKLKEWSPENTESQTVAVQLRMPWKFITEALNYNLEKINDSETKVILTSTPSLPISSYDFPATKKVLHYLRQHKAFKDNEKNRP